MKVFISYNHKDQPTALKVRDRLIGEGLEVILDTGQMQAGQNIEEFIQSSIRESDVTLSLISSNSLLSAWVAMETVMSRADEKMRRRSFLPCYIDKEFLNPLFTGLALEKVENELKRLSESIKYALEKGWGIEDQQSERSRYLALKTHLPEIIGKLRDSLCVDLTPDNFEAGMQKIVSDLKNHPHPSGGLVFVKEQTTDVINELQKTIQGTFDNLTKERLNSLSRRLSTLQELLERIEQEQELETDPVRRMRYERQIESTKNSIQKTINEIKSFGHPDSATIIL